MLRILTNSCCAQMGTGALQGRRALVTGASHGIVRGSALVSFGPCCFDMYIATFIHIFDMQGAAIAQRFAKEHASLILVARSADQLQEV